MHGEGLSVQRGAVALGRWNKIYIYGYPKERQMEIHARWVWFVLSFALIFL